MKADAKRTREETDRRLAEIEKAVLTIARNERHVEELDKRMDTMEKAPAHKWDKLQWLVIAAIATAVLGYVTSQVF